MIRLGKVLDNKMVDMKLSNSKLVKRAEKILVNELKITKKEAQVLINNKKSVRYFLDNFKK
jgi:N-acetylmuramic acid 6-phosphate etherase